MSRVMAGLRATLRLLLPSVRAERAYSARRSALIERACARALAGRPWLEDRHGAGFDERVVEYPWVMQRLGAGALLLDAGSTLNHGAMHPLVLSRYATVLHLNPYSDDGYRSDDAHVRYVRADVRAPGLRGGLSLITCISVLEHVGKDNSRYGATSGDGAATRGAPARALRALLAPGGRLLLTVPYGRAEDHGWFAQLDARALDEAIAEFGPAGVVVSYFHHRDGWREASAGECADARYGATGNRGASAVACAELTA